MIHYKIVSSYDYDVFKYGELDVLESDKDKLSVVVNEHISDGYYPVGGVAIRHGSQSGAYFIQALIKENKCPI